MVKVLFLINNLANGGAERVLVNLLNYINIDKYDVTLRVLADEGNNKSLLSKDICYEYVFKKSFKGIGLLYLLPEKFIYNKIIGKKEYDIIIVYLQGVLTRCISYAPQNQKTINYIHGKMTNEMKFIKGFKNSNNLKKCFCSYNSIVSVSKDVENSMRKLIGEEYNYSTIYNTFDVNNIIELSKQKINDLQNKDREFTICSVGKLEHVKGYSRLLSVVSRIKKEIGIHFKLIIVGTGSEEENLKNFIKDNDLEEYIDLIGFDPNPYKYIKNSDLFVCSSYSEGFSSVVVESIILGVPVVTTDCAGMKEILGSNNEYGLIVNNDEISLYEGLKKMILDYNLRIHYKKQAEIRADFFNVNSSVRAVENLIDEVMNNEH